MISGYTLSQEADEDLIGIFLYSLESFSVDQAEKYVRGIHGCFDLLIENPEIGRKATKVGPYIRRFVYEKHIIYYRFENGALKILRIIHHSQDPNPKSI